MNETLPDPDPVAEPEPENPDAEPDEDEDDELEPEQEPREPSEPSSETVLAERHKALASETRRHETRLRTIYGASYHLTLRSLPGQGTCASIEIPQLFVADRVTA